MEQYADYGLEVAAAHQGPPVAWGSLGKTDIRLRTLIDTGDRTTLTNRALKVQLQATDSLRLGFTHFNGAKGQAGAERRADPARRDHLGPRRFGFGPVHRVGHLDWEQPWSSAPKAVFFNTGFSLTPRGGLDVEGVYRDVNRVYHNSFVDYRSYRPQRAVNVDANYFLGDHEFKMGGGWRKNSVRVAVYMAWYRGAHETSRQLSRGTAECSL